MTNAIPTNGDQALPRFTIKAFVGALAILASAVTGACLLDAYDDTASPIAAAPSIIAQIAVPSPIVLASVVPPAAIPSVAMPVIDAALFDPAPLVDSPLALAPPLASDLEPPPAPPLAAPVVALAEPETPPVAVPTLPHLAEAVPLPTPRPPELRAPVDHAPLRSSGRQLARHDAASVPVADNRSFFEKLFGLQPSPPGVVLAYGEPDDGVLGRLRTAASTPMISADGRTAIYDIAAHTVFMPNGTRLEAHSGLGERLDDPRHVHERNRGATPPQTYNLTLREQLFHGVQALRLNPVGGGGVFGRTGLLAHTYMLGPNGDSNGCVSFKNYNEFLQAFSRGEVKRLVVVASRS